jgi:GntR family transcriptional regulator / MocR family aminotransferase
MTETPPFREAFPLDMLSVDRTSAEPIQRQLYRALATMIRDGNFPAGLQLPSTRSLAQDLDLARNTVIGAYDQLIAEGYLHNRPGARPIVVDLPSEASRTQAIRSSSQTPTISDRGEELLRQPFHHGVPGRVAFHPGIPDAQSFPFQVWGKLLAKRASFGGQNLFGTYHVTGLPELKEAIAGYLAAARGVRCAPENIVITTGAQAAFDLLARLLLDPGDPVWMEEPGYYAAQAAFTVAGGLVMPLSVNQSGWDLTLPPHQPRLIYVTPACQHPLGLTMRMDQRLRLLSTADDMNAWVIEDDFDGEYRLQGRPVPAIQSMDRSERVIYVGTFAKLLFPALRIGFMVLPDKLCGRIPHALSTTGQFAPLVLQAALADFIMEGHMSRHLKRMRRIYSSRRQSFSEACNERLADFLTLIPPEAGIQMVALLRGGLDDLEVQAQANQLGINVSPLSKYYRAKAGNQGLVLGYAACNSQQTEQGILRLEQALRSSARRS